MNLFLLVIITVREPLMHVICILFLKVKGIKDRIKSYDFIEGIDFQSFTEIVEREIGATKRIEYALSISMAKELSMIENNERGRQARKYFIACEENKHELSRKELALMVIQAEEEKERLALENKKQQKQIEKLQPKADFADAAFKKYCFRLVVWKVCVTLYRSQMTIAFVMLSKRLSCSYHTWAFFMPLLDIGGCLYVRL